MTVEARLQPLQWLGNLLVGRTRGIPFDVQRSANGLLGALLGRLVVRPGPDPARTEHRRVEVEGGSIGVRVYHPTGPGPHPMVVFLHGGGFCLGTLAECEPQCRAISAGAHCVVVSVDYRLAPENRFPTGVEDCYAALCWVAEHAHDLGGDRSRLAVAGVSAGGNLAAVCCLLARERSGPAICHQWLEVPLLDCTLSGESVAAHASGYGLEVEDMLTVGAEYLGPGVDPTDPRASPMHAASHADLPPAWIGVAEHDPLRSDGERYAELLRAAGGQAHVRLAVGHLHGTIGLTRYAPSAAAHERAGIEALAEAFTVPLLV